MDAVAVVTGVALPGGTELGHGVQVAWCGILYATLIWAKPEFRARLQGRSRAGLCWLEPAWQVCLGGGHQRHVPEKSR